MAVWKILLSLISIVCLILSGCTQTAGSTDASENAPTEAESSAADTAEQGDENSDEQLEAQHTQEPEQVDEEIAKAQRGEELKVIFLVPGNIDNTASMDAYNGLKRIEEEYGSTISFIEMGDNTDDWSAYLVSALDDDWDIILTMNSMAEPVMQFAGQYPDDRIIVLQDFEGELPPNVFKVRFDLAEASFLAGACATLVTTSDMEFANEAPVIGFVGGMSLPVIDYNFLAGYIEGAKYVDDNIKVLVSYTDNFIDQSIGAEAASTQFSEGVDIVFHAAGPAGNGVISSAAAQGKYVIGVDYDQSAQYEEESPNIAALILTSVVRLNEGAVYWAVDQHLSNTLEYGSQEQTAGLAENAVGIIMNSYYDQISPDIRAQIDEIAAKIVSGEITLESSIDMDAETFSRLVESVKP